MINPFADPYAVGLTVLLPTLVLLFGALVLGTLIGYTHGPKPKESGAFLSAQLERMRGQLSAAESRMSTTAAVMKQRQVLREEELAAERRALEQEIAALNAECESLRMALAAARRTVPVEGKANSADDGLKARMAELERSAARVPRLLNEVHALYELIAVEASPTRPEARSDRKGTERDDLRLVEGIGPKIAAHLQAHGLRTWGDVAAARPEDLRKVLDEGGERFQMHDPSSWPKQCRLMMEERWEELRKYQSSVARARS